jgi:hypothetical protein
MKKKANLPATGSNFGQFGLIAGSMLASSLARSAVTGAATGVANAINKVEQEQASVLFGADKNKSIGQTIGEMGMLLKYRNKPLRIIPADKEDEYFTKKLEKELNELQNGQSQENNYLR